MHLTRERIKTPLEALVYYADCAVATYEHSLMVKKYSKADRERFRRIAEGMVTQADTFVRVMDADWYRTELLEEVERVKQRLSNAREG